MHVGVFLAVKFPQLIEFVPDLVQRLEFVVPPFYRLGSELEKDVTRIVDKM